MTADDLPRSLSFDHTERIALPSSGSAELRAIRRADLDRIRRMVSRAKEPEPWIPIVYSIAFTVAVSSGLSIIPLGPATDLAPWVVPVHWSVMAFSLLFGLVFVGVDLRDRRDRQRDATDLQEEMEVLDRLFEESA